MNELITFYPVLKNTDITNPPKKKLETNENDFYLINLMMSIMNHKKMRAQIIQHGQILNQDENLDGNISDNDESVLRYLTIYVSNSSTTLLMEFQFIKPDQEVLSLGESHDLIFNYLLLNLNRQSNDIIYYSKMNQIFGKCLIFLPYLNYQEQKKISEDQFNQIIISVSAYFDSVENEIVSKQDIIYSAADLDQFSIEQYFPNHVNFLNQYLDDNFKPNIDDKLKYQCIQARKCNYFQGQLSIGEEKHLSKQNLTETELDILKTSEDVFLTNLSYSVKYYYVDQKIEQQNQQNADSLRYLLNGQLFQEFQRKQTSQVSETLFQNGLDQIYFPIEDPKHKNALQEQLPQVEKSTYTKLCILYDVVFALKDQQQLLKNQNFKGKLSIIVKIRFCDILGCTPILIKKKKEKKKIKDNHKRCITIIQDLIKALFFSDSFYEKIKTIEDLCGEYLRDLQYCKEENFPDYDEILFRLEKLILLIQQIYCIYI